MASWPFMADAEPDVLGYMTFPARHRTKLHKPNPLERLNKEVKRRAPPRSADRVSSRDRMKGLLAFHRRRHLPQRGEHRPPHRRRPSRGQRRMATAAPIHAGRSDGRTRRNRRRCPVHDDQRQGRMTMAAPVTPEIDTSLTDMTCRNLSLCVDALKSITKDAEKVRPQCRVAGRALRPARPPENRTCGFSRIRLEHPPAGSRSPVVAVRDGTSGGRERGRCLRLRDHGAPQGWCCRPARGPDRGPTCRPRTGRLVV